MSCLYLFKFSTPLSNSIIYSFGICFCDDNAYTDNGLSFVFVVLGVEVKAGQPLKVKPTFDNIIHLSQVLILYSCVHVELKICFNAIENCLFVL